MLSFTYSKIYFNKIEREYKIVSRILTFVALIISLAYPIFAIFVKLGNFYINCIIFCLTVFYVAFQIFFIVKKNKVKTKFVVEEAYKYIRNIITLCAIGINIYNIYIASTNANGVAIIMTTLMIIAWALKLIIDVSWDILSPRVKLFWMCVKEDLKPLAKIVDKFSDSPIFEYWKEDVPVELSKAISDVDKIADHKKLKMLSKQVELDYEREFDIIDTNKDGKISIEELITQLLTYDNVIVNKENFIHGRFSLELLNPDLIKQFEKSGPLKVGFKEEDLSLFADKLTLENKRYVEKFKKYIDDDFLKINKERDYKKAVKYFIPILQTMQKIIYVYGFNEPKLEPNKDKITVQCLILAYFIALDTEYKEEAKLSLLKIKKMYLHYQLKSKLFFNKGFNIEKFKIKVQKSIPLLKDALDEEEKPE